MVKTINQDSYQDVKGSEHVVVDNIEYKRCGCCHKLLPIYEFHKDKSRKDGLSNSCKECTKEKNHKTYMKDPQGKYEKVKEYQKKTGLFYRYHPYNPNYYSSEKSKQKKRARDLNRRLLKKNADAKEKITDITIQRLLEKYDNKCAYCGIDIKDNYTIDHKLPLSRGGDNSFDNLALACRHCNCSKHDKTDVEFCGHVV